jgi:predicted Zn-dependent protease
MVVLWFIDKSNLQKVTMKRLIIQAFISVVLFIFIWFALSKIDWINVFNVQRMSKQTDEEIGDIFWEVIKKSEKENTDKYTLISIDSIVNHVCRSNQLIRTKIKIHILENDEINAFALPNGNLIVNSGLILNSDNEEELAGVLCHEIAHIELNHITKKLIKEIGLSVLISMTTGNSGSEVIKESVKILSSSAFDRSLEKEADIQAVNYMLNSQIDPIPFSEFLYKLSKKEDIKYLTWISTHPDSKERANYIVEYSKNKSIEYKSIISDRTWSEMRSKIKSTIN